MLVSCCSTSVKERVRLWLLWLDTLEFRWMTFEDRFGIKLTFSSKSTGEMAPKRSAKKKLINFIHTVSNANSPASSGTHHERWGSSVLQLPENKKAFLTICSGLDQHTWHTISNQRDLIFVPMPYSPCVCCCGMNRPYTLYVGSCMINLLCS